MVGFLFEFFFPAELFFDLGFKMSPESVHAKGGLQLLQFFPEPCVFAMKFKIFFIKGIFHGRPSLLLRVGQLIKECLLLITKSLKIQDKLILI